MPHTVKGKKNGFKKKLFKTLVKFTINILFSDKMPTLHLEKKKVAVN